LALHLIPSLPRCASSFGFHLGGSFHSGIAEPFADVVGGRVQTALSFAVFFRKEDLLPLPGTLDAAGTDPQQADGKRPVG